MFDYLIPIIPLNIAANNIPLESLYGYELKIMWEVLSNFYLRIKSSCCRIFSFYLHFYFKSAVSFVYNIYFYILFLVIAIKGALGCKTNLIISCPI
jgi:hypothetical protein